MSAAVFAVESLTVPLSLSTTSALRAAQGGSLAALCDGPIGVFDSGLGGLSVWRHLLADLPGEDFIYVADNAHVPYGDKSEAWIRARMVALTEFFLAQGCKAIVWACNSATAAGATFVRAQYPEVFFVGLEPALKPALPLSATGRVAVLATARTIASDKYHRLLTRMQAQYPTAQIASIACVGWAEAIETGQTEGDAWQALLHRYLQPVQDMAADVVVLGCTHYPFIADDIRAALGASVRLIDSGAPVGRYTEHILQLRDGLRRSPPTKPESARLRHFASRIDESITARWLMLSGLPEVQLQPLII